jgi:hypothetical protein
MIPPKPFVEIMQDIVTATSDKLIAQLQEVNPKIVALNYQYGHLKEIIQTMQEDEKAPTFRPKKYPLVALMMDFPEEKGNAGGYFGKVTVQMVIAHISDPRLKAKQRYAATFKPILLPIYYELLEQIHSSLAIVTMSVKQIQHTKYDRPYWGSNGLSDTAGNVFNDVIDAIEIQNLQLTINNNCI